MIVVTGNPVPIEKLEEIDITPSGMSYTLSVDGVKPYVLELLSWYSQRASDVSYRANGATARITARYSGPAPGVVEVPLDNISLKTSEVGQALYLNKRYASLPPVVIKEVRQTVQDGTKYSEAVAKIGQAAIDAGGSLAQIDARGALALELYDYLISGTDTYQVCVRTITRVRTVSKSFNTKVSQDDVEKLFTPAQMVEALSGSTLPFTVPALVLTAEEAAKGWIVSWRKMMCDVDDTAGGQRQLTEAWQLAKWSPHYDVKAP